MEYLFIGVGGSIGALARYSVSKWVGRRWSDVQFPVATFSINITGSFLLGIMFTLLAGAAPEADYLISMGTTGILVAFTTYSTFSFETVSLMRQDNKVTALIYLVASLILGFLAAYTGFVLGRFLSG